MKAAQKYLLSALGALLILVLAWLFLISPQLQERTELQEAAENARVQQQTLRTQISRLQQVRAESPELEALLVAADTIIPRNDAALPAALRQLQMAANEAGAQLISVSMSRPTTPQSATDTPFPTGIAQIGITVTVEGGYFQLVDFLRRVEDPVLSPRAILWNSATVSETEYPTLSVNLAGAMYAYLETGTPAPTPADDATDEPTDDSTDGANENGGDA
jgi:Tfp pilus assembly protein PilO